MDDEERRERDEAIRAHDRLMANAAEEEGRRNAARALLSRGIGPAGVLIAATVDNAPVPTPEPGASADGWQGWNNWMAHHLDLVRAEIMQAVAEVVIETKANLREQWRQDIHNHIGVLKDQGRTVHNVYARVDERLKEFNAQIEFVVENEWEQRQRRADATQHGLHAENLELKSLLGTVLQRLEKSDAAVKALAAELVSARKDQEALIDSFESRFAELRAFVRGSVRDWTAA